MGLIVQEFILKEPESPLAQKAVEHLRQQAAALAREAISDTLYNGTLAMFLAGGDAWKDWNGAVRDAVVKRQSKAGCSRGSWDDPTLLRDRTARRWTPPGRSSRWKCIIDTPPNTKRITDPHDVLQGDVLQGLSCGSPGPRRAGCGSRIRRRFRV